ncbi:MAG: nucleotidyltransferase family protein [Clostridiales bacterium]|nr:nucleotidyltransferase family protein [Clostridiales bacterium]
MKVVGVIAEFNPFHNGHQYLFHTIRNIYEADYLVVIMSGNYVQRGEPALIHKFSRTRMALEAGADLVLELPLPFAISSAELFGLGGIMALSSLNTVTHIAFGCEETQPDPDIFSSIAHFLIEEPASFQEAIKKRLSQGMSYPAARKEALLSLGLFPPEQLSLLDSPNNLLGIEYIKGINRIHSSLIPIMIPRNGSGHHETASGIRKILTKESPDLSTLSEWMPEHAVTILKQQWNDQYPVTADDYSCYLYYALTTHNAQYYTDNCILSQDEAARIYRNLPGFSGFTSFCHRVKSKQYAYTRISRAMLRIILDQPHLTITDQNALPSLPYLRLLGMKKEASHLLSKASIPIISKPAHMKKYKEGFKELSANSLYYQIPALKYHNRPILELECSPIIY